MKTVFADTGYWIAISNPHDELHNKAITIAEELASLHIVTSEMVFVEFLTFASSHGKDARSLAVKTVRACMNNPEIEVVPQSSKQFYEALDHFARYSDKKWSLTDCASFVIMKDLNIYEALAHDQNFEQAGFIALLRQT